jgi:hypothetical protein
MRFLWAFYFHTNRELHVNTEHTYKMPEIFFLSCKNYSTSNLYEIFANIKHYRNLMAYNTLLKLVLKTEQLNLAQIGHKSNGSYSKWMRWVKKAKNTEATSKLHRRSTQLLTISLFFCTHSSISSKSLSLSKSWKISHTDQQLTCWGIKAIMLSRNSSEGLYCNPQCFQRIIWIWPLMW